MSGNSSDDGEGAPPGGAEIGYVTAGAYTAALDESVLLSSENEWLKMRVMELEGAGLADGRRVRNTIRMKKNETGQLDYRNKGKVKEFVRKDMKPVYMRMPAGCMQWSENPKTPCARIMAVMIVPESASPRWYWENFGSSFLNAAYIELNSDEAQKLKKEFKGEFQTRMMSRSTKMTRSNQSAQPTGQTPHIQRGLRRGRRRSGTPRGLTAATTTPILCSTSSGSTWGA